MIRRSDIEIARLIVHEAGHLADNCENGEEPALEAEAAFLECIQQQWMSIGNLWDLSNSWINKAEGDPAAGQLTGESSEDFAGEEAPEVRTSAPLSIDSRSLVPTVF